MARFNSPFGNGTLGASEYNATATGGQADIWPWMQRVDAVTPQWPKLVGGYGPPGPKAIADWISARIIEIEFSNGVSSWTQEIERGQSVTRTTRDGSDDTETTGTALDGSLIQHRLEGAFTATWDYIVGDVSAFLYVNIPAPQWIWTLPDSCWYGRFDLRYDRSEWDGEAYIDTGWRTPELTWDEPTISNRVVFSGFGVMGSEGAVNYGANDPDSAVLTITRKKGWNDP